MKQNDAEGSQAPSMRWFRDQVLDSCSSKTRQAVAWALRAPCGRHNIAPATHLRPWPAWPGHPATSQPFSPRHVQRARGSGCSRPMSCTPWQRSSPSATKVPPWRGPGAKSNGMPGALLPPPGLSGWSRYTGVGPDHLLRPHEALVPRSWQGVHQPSQQTRVPPPWP